ncbi:D-2-hydroxyacid dehydrogenase [Rhodovarius crocodyli]|uniref:D-2-hydroxyacid dehydrogenase n=1 Tax=Rhodovarius crocodyli TaxID=1979269 RepID=A0A437MHB5_9PROT|nr:NAD(P)-dependent oxidoreductase [Rhodovarius crocodyli]RVT97026.1 D-2-hydroxyacid dehydrogenase [Rhodovarius crocodyli]
MKLLITQPALAEVGSLPPGVEPMIYDQHNPPSGFDAAFLSRELFSGGSRDAPPPAWRIFMEAVAANQGLQWLQIHSAGADRPIYRELVARGVKVTTSAGANAVAVAQSAVAMLMGLSRGLPAWIEAQNARRWSPAKLPFPADLQGSRATVVGMGPVGNEIGRLLAAVGLEVRGLSRSARATPPEGFISAGVYADLAGLLPQTDWLVLACPLADATRGLLGEAQLAALPKGAGLVNVSRGGVADEAAVRAALESGQLMGAYMDVFTQEPLPPDSPWWGTKNTIISSHAAGPAAGNMMRAARLFRDNLDRFMAGERLVNEVG